MKKIQDRIKNKSNDEIPTIIIGIIDSRESKLYKTEEKMEMLEHSLKFVKEVNLESSNEKKFVKAKLISFYLLQMVTRGIFGNYPYKDESWELMKSIGIYNLQPRERMDYYRIWGDYILNKLQNFKDFDKRMEEFKRLKKVISVDNQNDEFKKNSHLGMIHLKIGLLYGVRAQNERNSNFIEKQDQVLTESINLFESIGDKSNALYAKFKLAEATVGNALNVLQLHQMNTERPDLARLAMDKMEDKKMKGMSEKIDFQNLSKVMFNNAKKMLIECIDNYNLLSDEYFIFLNMKIAVARCLFGLGDYTDSLVLLEEILKIIFRKLWI